MFDILIALTSYALIVIIDILRIRRYARIICSEVSIQKSLMLHMISALLMPFVLVIMVSAVTKVDIMYILVVSLVGVWLCMSGAIREMLGAMKPKE